MTGSKTLLRIALFLNWCRSGTTHRTGATRRRISLLLHGVRKLSQWVHPNMIYPAILTIK